MESSPIRVRFAPAPSGMMHLGNVRTALLNYLFAQQKKGTFIVRIEDTDAERNFDPTAQGIINDLTWLGLIFDEGPRKGGPYAPYFQSERSDLYSQKLQELEKKGSIYRCFCTPQELEKKRERQRALKQPPRYDRTCIKLTEQQIAEQLDNKSPFIWRLKTMQDRTITLHDLARGAITFNLKEVSDIPLTRTDGSFTFIFANGVDDICMKISHVIRGEDHLTNTAGQIVLYEALDATPPVFWHLPIICNLEGKKLSKRDFGFSLNDLRNAGYLQEAIDNYLGIIGGSFEQEILSLEQLVHSLNFDAIHTSGQVKYDSEKLGWLNHKWINKLEVEELARRCLPFLVTPYPHAKNLQSSMLNQLIQAIRTDLVTLADVVSATRFYFERPTVPKTDLVHDCLVILNNNRSLLSDEQRFIEACKQEAKQKNVPLKQLFETVRRILTSNPEGLGIKELFALLGPQEVALRFNQFLD